ncbi:hypothetical protein ACOME3_005513 [Neoechinorhynchus agilis]
MMLLSIFILLNIPTVTSVNVAVVVVKVKQNHNYTLKCETNQTFEPDIVTFNLNGAMISVNNVLNKDVKRDYLISSDNRTQLPILTIIRAQKRHNGIYTCEKFGSHVIGKFNVTVLVPPSVPLVISNKKVVKSGDQIQLNCTSMEMGNPPALVSWYRLSTADKWNKFAEGSAVKLAVTANHNSCRIKCSLLNEAINKDLYSADFTLNVEYCPILSIFANGSSVTTKVQKVMFGDTLAVSCVGHGNPQIREYFWTKGGEIISKSRNFAIQQVSDNDAGEYRCLASSSNCMANISFNLNVLYAPRVRIIEQRGIPIVVNQSDNLVLNCCIKSNPNASRLIWLLDNVPLSNVSISQISNIEACYHLSLYPIGELDAGQYICQATNDVENGSLVGSDSVEIIVQVPPSHSITEQVNLVSAALGSSTVLNCTMKGFPLPSISWLKGLITHRSTSCVPLTKNVVRCQLRIGSIKPIDYGNYTCVGKNSLGITKSIQEVTPKTVPGKPLNLTATKVTYSWIHICWDSGDGDDADSFIVDIGPPYWQVRTTDTCINITGLSESFQYRLRVSAVNVVGKSQWSNRLLVTTNEYPVKFRDMPQVINWQYKSNEKLLQFDFTPFRRDLISIGQMCLSVYLSYENRDQFQKAHRCFPIRNGHYVSLRTLDMGKIKEIRASVCSVEKQSLCGSETDIDLEHSDRIGRAFVPLLSLTLFVLIAIISATSCLTRHFSRKIKLLTMNNGSERSSSGSSSRGTSNIQRLDAVDQSSRPKIAINQYRNNHYGAPSSIIL